MSILSSWFERSSALMIAILTVAALVGMAPDNTPSTQPGAKKLGPIHKVVLKDLEGNDLPLSQFADKPIIMEVWATWCGPCVKQRKIVHSVVDKLKEHVHVIAASVDKTTDVVKAYVKKNPSDGIVEAMITPALREAMKGKDRQPTIPKVLYISSRGEILEITYGDQSADWLVARAKTLK